MLDATAPFSENAVHIARAAEAAVGSRTSACTVPHLAPPPAAASRRTGPLPVYVGDDGASVALGRDIASLGTLLRREVGRVADGVPASFWIEAYAAQLILDARTTTAAHATVALWPSALRRMPTFSDLHTLDELTRLLDASVHVECWSPSAGDSLWEIIAPSSTARSRLSAEYAEALVQVARERGWRAAPRERLMMMRERVG